MSEVINLLEMELLLLPEAMVVCPTPRRNALPNDRVVVECSNERRTRSDQMDRPRSGATKDHLQRLDSSGTRLIVGCHRFWKVINYSYVADNPWTTPVQAPN